MANKFAKNDEAVSAVIGVILMVAITVILAAVIAAFVFGMGSSIKKTYVVSITIERTSSGDVYVTNTGGPDAGSLSSLTIACSDTKASGVSGSITSLAGTSGVGKSINIGNVRREIPRGRYRSIQRWNLAGIILG